MRIAVIGFGFSGLMVAANLVRAAEGPLELYLVAQDTTGKGLAYGTLNPRHLLNVRAGNMSAWADEAGDFVRFLASDAGKYAAARWQTTQPLATTDFAPRALYGDYLTSIWNGTQQRAGEKGLVIKMVPTTASRIELGTPLTVMTDRGDAITVDRAVIASGNESRPALRDLEPGAVIQNPWAAHALDTAVASAGPVVLIGSGLTAVDMVLSLRKAAYGGDIIAISRRGLLPQPHKAPAHEYIWDKDTLLAQPSLGALLQLVRRTIRQHTAEGGDWRAVIDGLRPYTQRLWQHLSTRDQQRFLARLLPYWNVHRHRMAPEIAAQLAREIEEGKLRVLASRSMNAGMESGKAKLTVATGRGPTHEIFPTAIINCIGPELRLQQTAHNMLKQLLADGLAEIPPNGVGIAADPHYRVFGEAYPNLYAIGSLMTGQFLESTAVPELRGQAAAVAKHILKA